MITLPVLVATTLAGLSCVHAYWAAGGRWGHGAAGPERHGRPSFRPVAPNRRREVPMSAPLTAASAVLG
jgi:hypothetical protein